MTRDTDKFELLRPSSPQASPARSLRHLVPRGRVQGGGGTTCSEGRLNQESSEKSQPIQVHGC